MRHEDLGGRSIAQALARERIHMLGEGDELLLTDSGEIGIARHEAAGVLPLGRRSLYCGYRIHRSSCTPTGSGAISACADRTYDSSYTRSAELL